MPKKYILIAFSKLTLVFLLIIGTTSFFIYSYFIAAKGRPPRIDTIESTFNNNDLLILPYSTKSYAGYGKVFEPQIELDIIGDNNETHRVEFLLDSGAVVSTLPMSYADMLNIDLEKAQRIVLRGFGDNRSFGYMSNMTIKVKDQFIEIPVVYSEGELSKKILGRNGFFDTFTITFDHNDKVIRISK